MKNGSVPSKWSSFLTDGYTSAEWLCIKVSLLAIVLPSLLYILFTRPGQPYPVGICTCIDCSVLAGEGFRYFFSGLLLLLAVLYLCEVKMRYTTFALFGLGVIIYSLDESNGIKARTGIYSLAFFTQFAAYLLHGNKPPDAVLAKNRVQFTAQIIAAVYVLSAIAKLSTLGILWITDSPNVALQILKSYSYRYFDTGLVTYNATGADWAAWVARHTWWIKAMFSAALLLELFAFVLLGKKKWAFFYAILLLAMHVGILVLMDVYFPTVIYPLLIFFINPLYILFLTGQSLYLSIIPGTNNDKN